MYLRHRIVGNCLDVDVEWDLRRFRKCAVPEGIEIRLARQGRTIRDEFGKGLVCEWHAFSPILDRVTAETGPASIRVATRHQARKRTPDQQSGVAQVGSDRIEPQGAENVLVRPADGVLDVKADVGTGNKVNEAWVPRGSGPAFECGLTAVKRIKTAKRENHGHNRFARSGSPGRTGRKHLPCPGTTVARIRHAPHLASTVERFQQCGDKETECLVDDKAALLELAPDCHHGVTAHPLGPDLVAQLIGYPIMNCIEREAHALRLGGQGYAQVVEVYPLKQAIESGIPVFPDCITAVAAHLTCPSAATTGDHSTRIVVGPHECNPT